MEREGATGSLLRGGLCSLNAHIIGYPIKGVRDPECSILKHMQCLSLEDRLLCSRRFFFLLEQCGSHVIKE